MHTKFHFAKNKTGSDIIVLVLTLWYGKLFEFVFYSKSLIFADKPAKIFMYFPQK